MAIDLKIEKELKLSPQEVYDICDFAVQASYDDGFMNSYIFERALYIFAAIRLYEDKAEEITALAAQNINSAWEYLVVEGVVVDMMAQYSTECDYLAAVGAQWFIDYTTYAHSARGLLNTIQTFTGDLVSKAAEQFKNMNDGSDVQKVLDIADEWGMNNALPHESESLFND